MQYPWEMSKKEFFVAVCCFLCSFLVTFNATMVTAIMTPFQEAWNVDYSYAMWFKEDISIAMIIFGLIGVAIADKFGKKNVIMAGLVIVIVTSIFCVFNKTFEGIMISRMLTGLGISLIAVSSVSILTDVTKKEHLAEVIAMTTSASCIGAIIAPTIGLMWTKAFGVMTVYLMLVPFCIICLLLFRNIENKVSRPDLKINVPLHTLYIVGVFLILLVMFNTQVSNRLLIAAIGAAVFIGFAVLNHYSKDKIFDVKVFKIRPFAMGVFLGLVFSFIMYAITNVITGYLQILDGTIIFFGSTVTLVGVSSFALGLKPFIQAVFSPISAKWNTKHPNIDFTVIGFAVMVIPIAISFVVLMTLDMNQLANMSIVIFIVMAIGYTLFTPTNKKMMMGSVSSEDRNFASSMTMLISPVSMVLGVIALENLLNGNTTAATYSSSGLILTAIVVMVFIFGIIAIVSRSIFRKRMV